jgi:PLP dependent protein
VTDRNDEMAVALVERANTIDENRKAVLRRVANAGGSPTVDLVAVSKGQDLLAIQAAAEVGFRLFGENYADELVAKAVDPNLSRYGIDWTFQGRLQTNKINRLKPHVGLWQTVDTIERAQALSKRAPGAKVLIQLNLTGAAERSGVTLSEASELIVASRMLELNVVGVMGVGPDPEDPTTLPGASESAFRSAVLVADLHDLPVRSLGMSADFEVAVRAGSTMIRVGSVLFGSRENLHANL